MAQQRNKAHHLAAAASATRATNEAKRRQIAHALMARKAGATWAEIAEATGMASKQAARQHFVTYETDGENVWQAKTLL